MREPQSGAISSIGIGRIVSELVKNYLIGRLLPTGKFCQNIPIDDVIAVILQNEEFGVPGRVDVPMVAMALHS